MYCILSSRVSLSKLIYGRRLIYGRSTIVPVVVQVAEGDAFLVLVHQTEGMKKLMSQVAMLSKTSVQLAFSKKKKKKMCATILLHCRYRQVIMDVNLLSIYGKRLKSILLIFCLVLSLSLFFFLPRPYRA